MKLTSKNFTDGGKLPAKYTCDGESVAPEFTWLEYPAETKSFVLTCNDPDAPGGNFIHWIVINIPLETTGIPEGVVNINGGEGIKNDFGKEEYGAPCPPGGSHHYIFSIYALNTAKLENIDKNNLESQIKPYILDKAQITSLYSR